MSITQFLGERHDRMGLTNIEALCQMLLVDLGNAVILPAIEVEKNIIDGLLQCLQFRLVHKLSRDLLWQNIQEHGFKVVIRQATTMLILDSLPSA